MPEVAEVDPFDLPEWLGQVEVTWHATSGVSGSHHISGDLTGGATPQSCDLLAVDVAYPQPVIDAEWRRAAHQQWTHGQVLLLRYADRMTLAVPGTDFTADRVLETLGRLAKAVGVKPARFVAALRL